MESETIRNVRSRLSGLHDLLLNAQCKKAASDIGLLMTLLEGCSQSSVAQFVADTNSWMTKSQGKIKSSNTELRADVVARYIDKLRSFEGENDLFDQLMRSLSADKNARLAEVREIASKYIGFEIAKKKSKTDALKAIVDHQAFNARQIARGGNQS
jgi:Fe-S cluster assembly scaffold protein SufB